MDDLGYIIEEEFVGPHFAHLVPFDRDAYVEEFGTFGLECSWSFAGEDMDGTFKEFPCNKASEVKLVWRNVFGIEDYDMFCEEHGPAALTWAEKEEEYR